MNEPSSLTSGAVSESARLYKIASIVLVLLCLAPLHLTHAGNAPVGGGGSCSYSLAFDGTVGQQQAYDNGYTCLSASSTWTPEAFIVGSALASGSAATCSASYAGLIDYTGGGFQYCNGTSWLTFGSINPTSGTLGATSGVLVELAAGTFAAPSLTFYNDTTTGLYQPTLYTLAVTTAGTERALFDGSGNFNLIKSTGAYEIDSAGILLTPPADTTYSLAIGISALTYDSNTGGGTNGEYNTVVGNEAMLGVSATPQTGTANAILGSQASVLMYTAPSYTTAAGALAFGSYNGCGGSAAQAYPGNSNTLVGDEVANGQVSASDIGDFANNVVVGFSASETPIYGYTDSVCVGGAGNSCYGWGSTAAFTDIIGIGEGAMVNSAADRDIGICTNGIGNITGTDDIGIGDNPLYAIGAGSQNIAIGFGGPGHAITTGNSNVAIGGYDDLTSATTDSESTVIGEQSLGSQAGAAAPNSAMGYQTAGNITTGTNNTAIGNDSMIGVTTAQYNTAIGLEAMQGTTTTPLVSGGNGNTAMGVYALDVIRHLDAGNTAFGESAGVDLTTGSNNTLVGYTAGNSITTGSSNVILGEVGLTTTGGTNILIGNNLAQAAAGTGAQIDIGDNLMVYHDTHLVVHSTAPSISATCPTSTTGASVAGNDNAMVVTQGSGAASTTLCIVEFATAWTSTPVCIASFDQTPALGVSVSVVYSSGARTLTLYSNAAETGKKISVICTGYK
jgi:hypothetical protein